MPSTAPETARHRVGIRLPIFKIAISSYLWACPAAVRFVIRGLCAEHRRMKTLQEFQREDCVLGAHDKYGGRPVNSHRHFASFLHIAAVYLHLFHAHLPHNPPAGSRGVPRFDSTRHTSHRLQKTIVAKHTHPEIWRCRSFGSRRVNPISVTSSFWFRGGRAS